MQFDHKQLAELARDCPWRMFNCEELAVLCNISLTVITHIRAAPDSPFFLNKTRPEWFTEWMRSHCSFQIKQRVAEEKPSKKIDTDSSSPPPNHGDSNRSGRKRPRS